MIIIFGFRTPAATELPEILYIGEDGVEANRICEEDPHPRIARLDNPLLRPYKHWTEEASAAFEKKAGKKLDQPVVAPVTTEENNENAGDLTSTTEPLKPPPIPLSSAEMLEAGMSMDELKFMASDEGIETPGAKTKRDYAECIAIYRELDDAHNADEIKAKAHDEGVDVTGLKLKRDFLNAIVAQRRATAR